MAGIGYFDFNFLEDVVKSVRIAAEGAKKLGDAADSAQRIADVVVEHTPKIVKAVCIAADGLQKIGNAAEYMVTVDHGHRPHDPPPVLVFVEAVARLAKASEGWRKS